MRLLVTRPARNAALLADKLAAQGHDVIVSPLIDIVDTPNTLPAPAAYGALALTSANGVMALGARLGARAVFDMWSAKPAYAVGPRTAAALRQFDWPVIYQGEGDVAALAHAIGTRHQPGDGLVLHIAGAHQAGNLGDALAAHGLKTDKAILYEAIAAQTFTDAALCALADADAPVDAVLLYSPRSAQIFTTLYARLHAPYRPYALCLSPAIAAVMRGAGFRVKTAATPREDAMLALTAQLP